MTDTAKIYLLKVVADQEWNEYQVKVWRNGLPVPCLTYHTDDFEDAIATKRTMEAFLDDIAGTPRDEYRDKVKRPDRNPCRPM